MPRYTKKPVSIDAIQFHGDSELEGNVAEVQAWISQFGADPLHHFTTLGSDLAQIHTLEGPMMASKTDWIIRGIKGEFYPCRNDIFLATYVEGEVESPPPAPLPGIDAEPIGTLFIGQDGFIESASFNNRIALIDRGSYPLHVGPRSE